MRVCVCVRVHECGRVRIHSRARNGFRNMPLATASKLLLFTLDCGVRAVCGVRAHSPPHLAIPITERQVSGAGCGGDRSESPSARGSGAPCAQTAAQRASRICMTAVARDVQEERLT